MLFIEGLATTKLQPGLHLRLRVWSLKDMGLCLQAGGFNEKGAIEMHHGKCRIPLTEVKQSTTVFHILLGPPTYEIHYCIKIFYCKSGYTDRYHDTPY